MGNVRWAMAMMCLLSCSFIYMNRQNINMGIQDMVVMEEVTPLPTEEPKDAEDKSVLIPIKRTSLPHWGQLIQMDTDYFFSPAWNLKYKEVNAPSNGSLQLKNNLVPQADGVKRYNWTKTDQGLIVACFFVAYIMFMVPMGILTEKFGGKWILVNCLGVSALVSAIIPFITDYLVLVLVLRFILGVAQAGTFPSAFNIIVKWMPKSDRPLALGLLNVGGAFGNFMVYMSSGFIITAYHWPMLFYMSASLTGIYLILIIFVLSSDPDSSRLVSQEEKQHIKAGQKQSIPLDSDAGNSNVKIRPAVVEKPKTPWIKMLTTRSVLVLAFYKFASGWTNNMVLIEVPGYLNEIIHEDVRKNGMITAACAVCTMIIGVSSGYFSERFIEKGYATRTGMRKWFCSFAGFGCGLCLIIVPIVGLHHFTLVCVLMVNALLFGCNQGGENPISAEISLNFSTSVYTFCNMMQTSTGAILPYFVGFVLDHIDHATGWKLLFYGSGIMQIALTVVFVIFATTDRAEFDYLEEEVKSIRNSVQMKEVKSEKS